MGCPKITYRYQQEVINVPPLFVIGPLEKKEGRAETYVKNTPYRFNAKELDEETGLYYYGAGYYNPMTSVWLSVDPLAHKSPNQTPYHFVSNNPIMRIDPDGRTEFNVDKETGTITKVSPKGGDETDYYNVGTTNGEGNFETDQTITIDRPEGGENINSFRFKETENSTTSTFNMPGEDVCNTPHISDQQCGFVS